MSDSKRFRGGKWLTFIWFGFWLVLTIVQWDKASQMSLNEWGDFFAGIGGPVALLWLVLGYLQQGEELRINTLAIQQQAKELRNQVAESRKLVEQTEVSASATRDIAELGKKQHFQDKAVFDLRLKPDFRLENTLGGGNQVVFRICNQGGRISNLRFELLERDVELSIVEKDYCDTNESIELGVFMDFEDIIPPLTILINYKDVLNRMMYSQLRWNENKILVTIVDYKPFPIQIKT